MVLTIQQITELKGALSERFGVYLHVSDACGGQMFWFEEKPSEEVFEFVSQFLSKLGGKTDFTEDGKAFTVV
jgi:hypothetical protein